MVNGAGFEILLAAKVAIFRVFTPKSAFQKVRQIYLHSEINHEQLRSGGRGAPLCLPFFQCYQWLGAPSPPFKPLERRFSLSCALNGKPPAERENAARALNYQSTLWLPSQNGGSCVCLHPQRFTASVRSAVKAFGLLSVPACEPSQKGWLFDAPQRHSVIRFRTS